jgi:hypothetical protein
MITKAKAHRQKASVIGSMSFATPRARTVFAAQQKTAKARPRYAFPGPLCMLWVSATFIFSASRALINHPCANFHRVGKASLVFKNFLLYRSH